MEVYYFTAFFAKKRQSARWVHTHGGCVFVFTRAGLATAIMPSCDEPSVLNCPATYAFIIGAVPTAPARASAA